jgi:hypothetical protein
LLRLLKEHNLKASKRINHFKKIPPESGGQARQKVEQDGQACQKVEHDGQACQKEAGKPAKR